MARRTKEDAGKTRDSLLDAAENVFLNRGVSSATLNEIAKEAGVTRGALYWHFEDKVALFRAMHDRVKTPIDALYDQLTGGDDPVNGLRQLCVQVLQTVALDEHTRKVFTIMRLRFEDAHCGDNPFAEDMCQKRRQTLERFKKVFAHAETHKLLMPGVNPGFAATALHSYLSGIIWDYLRKPSVYPLVELAPQLIEHFFNGLVKKK